MPCPTCGGFDRDPIAPGYWSCTSLRVVVTEVGGPGLTNPYAGPPVIRQEHYVVCGTTYQEGGGSEIVEQCTCGTFAIGRCMECGQPVCGNHSGLWEGRRLCTRHLREAHDRQEAERGRAEGERIAEAIATSVREWEAWLAAARAALAQSADPIERTVRVVAALGGGSWPDWRREDRQLLQTLLLPEELAGHSPDAPWWWDHDAVQAWFLRAVKVPPQELPVVHIRTTFFGSTKREDSTAPGWSFSGGATVGVGGAPPPWPSVSVLKDGRRLLGANDEQGRTGFNETALALMAELTGLELLPRFPSVGFRHPQTGARVWPAD